MKLAICPYRLFKVSIYYLCLKFHTTSTQPAIVPPVYHSPSKNKQEYSSMSQRPTGGARTVAYLHLPISPSHSRLLTVLIVHDSDSPVLFHLHLRSSRAEISGILQHSRRPFAQTVVDFLSITSGSAVIGASGGEAWDRSARAGTHVCLRDHS